MLKFINRRKRLIFFLILLLCVVMIFLTMSNRTPAFVRDGLGFAIVPAQNFINNTINWSADTFTFFYSSEDVAALRAENVRLLEQLQELQMYVNRMELLEAQHIELVELMGLTQRYPQFEKVAAEIIARDNNNWNTSFLINKGRGDGIAFNMVVIAQGGLVGRVVSVGYNFSRVVPIIDEASNVSGINVRSGAFGFIRGDIALSNRGHVRMELGADADIVDGDTITTSLLGHIFPPGIIIGDVLEIVEGPQAGINAIVDPIVDFSNLNNVWVITDSFEMELVE